MKYTKRLVVIFIAFFCFVSITSAQSRYPSLKIDVFPSTLNYFGPNASDMYLAEFLIRDAIKTAFEEVWEHFLKNKSSITDKNFQAALELFHRKLLNSQVTLEKN